MERSSADLKLPRLKCQDTAPKLTTLYHQPVPLSQPEYSPVVTQQRISIDDKVTTIKDSRSKSSAYGLSDLNFNPHLKSKYFAKSPEYFKRKDRSLHSLDSQGAVDSLPVEKIIGSRMRDFDKQALIGLAKQGLYRHFQTKTPSTNRHRVIPKKKLKKRLKNDDLYQQLSKNSEKQPKESHMKKRSVTSTNQQSYSMAAFSKFINKAEQPRPNDLRNDTKYSQFKPSTIVPVHRALSKVYPSMPLTVKHAPK